MSVPDELAERPRTLGSGGCLIATLGGLASAIVANGGLMHLLRSCHDVDAGTNFALTFSWVFVVPLMWLAATLVLSLVCWLATRMTSSRATWIALVTLGAILVIAPLIWWYWSYGVSAASTGFVAPSCPAGAPAWWPSWLPLYSP